MTPRRCIVVVLLLAAALAGTPALAQEPAAAPPSGASSYQADTVPFTLIILGTRNASDVAVIRQNLARLPSVKRLVPLLESQKHLEFLGALAGSPESLLADVQSLAADRYAMESRDDKRRGLVITLRKLQDQ